MLLWRLAVAAVASLPFWYAIAGAAGAVDLGVDPGKELTLLLGLVALAGLLVTLAMTPLRQLTAWAGWLRVRRQLGLWTFFYATLHGLAFLAFLLGWQWADLWREIAERPYVLVGSLAWLGLLPLALTSYKAAMRKLGKRWKTLHQLIYLITALALLHMLWVVRADMTQWLLYALPAALLLAWRVPAVSAWIVAWRGALKKLAKNS